MRRALPTAWAASGRVADVIDRGECQTTERVWRLWDKHAESYDRQIQLFERVLFGDSRAWLCRQAVGDVLEVAIGTGRNLPFYPEGLRITGLDVSPAMLEIAGRREHGSSARDVQLRAGDAQALPYPDAAFDTVVCALSLCSIPDDRRAIDEMHRVLKPAGLLLLLDHVRGANRAVRFVQRLLEPLAWRPGGDHLLRRPLEHMRAHGFVVARRERFKAGVVERLAARRPSRAAGPEPHPSPEVGT